MRTAEIDMISISDHTLVLMEIHLNVHNERQWKWVLNKSLLQDGGVLANLDRELQAFFDTNQTGKIAPLSVWEAQKSHVRGILIEQGARRKKARSQQIDVR